MAYMLLARAVDFYSLLVFVWVMGSWFPQWRYQGWYRTVASLVEPYVNLFRALRLQFSGFDFSPMLAIFLLMLLRNALTGMAARSML